MNTFLRGRGAALLAILVCDGTFQAFGESAVTNAPAAPLPRESVPFPDPLPDPIEPFNRAMWEWNRALMTYIIKPTAKVYRAIVCPPLRTGIANFGRNINYPGRLINHLLQARWRGARDETYRCACNTVLGLGGFLDVANHFEIPKSDADFGQTMGKWGWQPNAYVMLPFYGPSSDRDTLGLMVDLTMNPLNYFSPYPAVPANPLTFLGPYTYASYLVTYNNLSDSVDKYVDSARAELDAYSDLKYLWAYGRDTHKPDLQLTNPPDEASWETLASVLFAPKSLDFQRRAKTDSTYLYTTGKRLPFTYWLQAKTAPVVYIVPGLGSHRLTSAVLALAELLYGHGFSVVTVSNPFNFEFMDRAATAALPGFVAQDVADLHFALTEIDRHLNANHPARLGRRALMGYSMGGFETLCVAAEAGASLPLIKFDRYLAIDSPVRLLHGVSVLDDFYRAPLAWPSDERSSRIDNAFLKVAAMSSPRWPTNAVMPFSGIESKFLVGSVFRLILRDTIYTSQLHDNEGILHEPIKSFHREPVYREIVQFSFDDYNRRFVVPYYQSRGLQGDLMQQFGLSGDLHSYQAQLSGNPQVRLIVNENDFLLAPADLNWLQSSFSSEQLHTFPHGGHLGNLAQPEVQNAILHALEHLR